MWIIENWILFASMFAMYILGRQHSAGNNDIKRMFYALLCGLFWPVWLSIQIWGAFAPKKPEAEYSWSGRFEYTNQILYLRPEHTNNTLRGLLFKDSMPQEDLHPDVRIKKANPHDLNQIDEGALWFNEEPDGRLRLNCVSFNSTFTKKRYCNEEGGG